MSNIKYRLKVTSRGVKPLFLLLRTQLCVCSFFVVLFEVFGVCGGYHEQKFAMEPQDQVRHLYRYIFLSPFLTGFME